MTIVLAGLAVLLVIAGLIFFAMKLRRSRNGDHELGQRETDELLKEIFADNTRPRS